MSNADKEAVKQQRQEMRTYWINMQCTMQELAAEFDVSQDLAHEQIVKAKRERNATIS